jgi:cytochrome c oxidase subunit 3
MATLNPTIPARGGYGGGDGVAPDYAGRLRRARLALAILLTPVVMLFVSFTSAYIVRQGLPTLDEHSAQYVRDWAPVQLPLRLLLVNTLVLVASTVTMEAARRQTARRAMLSPVRDIPGVSVGEDRLSPWLPVTVALGTVFLSGQWMAWRQLAAHGVYVASNPSSSFVYLLTAAHGLHLLGGMVALLLAMTLAARHRQPERQFIIVDGAAWYWHFMGLLWLYIFGLLQFAK